MSAAPEGLGRMAVFPIGGSVDRFAASRATVILLLLMVAATGALLIWPGLRVVERFGYSSETLRRGEWWRLLTWIIPQSFGLPHLALNGFALYLYGPYLEGLLGWPKFTLVFAVAGIAGGAWVYGTTADVELSSGASQAVFGVIGGLVGYAIWSPIESSAGVQDLRAAVAVNLCILGVMVPLGVLADLYLGNGWRWDRIGAWLGGHAPGQLAGLALAFGLGARNSRWALTLGIAVPVAVLGLAVLVTSRPFAR